MSQIVLSPNAAGSAQFTLAAPGTNTNQTTTLPDATGIAYNTGLGPLSMRNKIINGKMEIAQRGTSFAAIANGAYSLDRWRVDYSGTLAVVTASQQADVPSSNEFQNSLRFAVTTADASVGATENWVLRQIVEGYNARDLIGRTFTLSFWVRSSKTGTHCVALRNSGADRSYIAEYTINAANTWEQKTITVSGGLITAGTWNWTNGIGLDLAWVLVCGSTFQTTAGAWQTGNFLATANQVNCLDTIGNIFAITGVQLEVGSVATPFEHRPFGAELALCQRYCPAWVFDNSVNSYGLSGQCISTTQAVVPLVFQVQPRVAPTGVSVSSATHFQVTGSTGSPVACSAVAFNQSSKQSLMVLATVASGLTAGNATVLGGSNTSALLIGTGCEL